MFGLPSLDLDISGPDLVPPAIPSWGGVRGGFVQALLCSSRGLVASAMAAMDRCGGCLFRSQAVGKHLPPCNSEGQCDGGLHWFALLSPSGGSASGWWQAPLLHSGPGGVALQPTGWSCVWVAR